MASEYRIPVGATGWKRLIYRIATTLIAFQIIGYAPPPDTTATALGAGIYYTVALYTFFIGNILLTVDVAVVSWGTVIHFLTGFVAHAIVTAGALGASSLPLVLRALAVVLTVLAILPLAARPFGPSVHESDSATPQQKPEEYGYNDKWEQENL